MLTIKCDCGESYFAGEQQLGKSFQCKKCGTVLTVQRFSPPLTNKAPVLAQTVPPVVKQNNKEVVWKSRLSSSIDFSPWFQRLFMGGVVLFLAIVMTFFKEATSSKPPYTQQATQLEPDNYASNTSPDNHPEKSHNDYYGYPIKYYLSAHLIQDLVLLNRDSLSLYKRQSSFGRNL